MLVLAARDGDSAIYQKVCADQPISHIGGVFGHRLLRESYGTLNQEWLAEIKSDERYPRRDHGEEMPSQLAEEQQEERPRSFVGKVSPGPMQPKIKVVGCQVLVQW